MCRSIDKMYIDQLLDVSTEDLFLWIDDGHLKTIEPMKRGTRNKQTSFEERSYKIGQAVVS